MLGGPGLGDLGPANASTWLETEQTILEVHLSKAITTAGGQITGITVPEGCEAEGQFSYPIAQGSFQFKCDKLTTPRTLQSGPKP
jgi:hypothetical protein